MSKAKFHLQDPSQRTLEGEPTQILTVFALFEGEWDDLINDRSKPRSVVLDEALQKISLSKEESDKWNSDSAYTNYNCAHCSYGLALSECECCKHQFKDNYFRSGWFTPLPKKIVSFLEENDHSFAVDPRIAQAMEEGMWKARPALRLHRA